MDATGLLVNKYKLNRKLTDEERANRIDQKLRVDGTPFYNLSVIRMNSTYIECIDRWFRERGYLTLISLLALSGLSAMLWYVVISRILFDDALHKEYQIWWFGPGFFILFSIGYYIFSLPLRTECFTLTHFPIRFNYRNRMVYAFRPNGTIVSAKWDDIFFTLGRGIYYSGVQNWDIRGHILDKDGETVLYTFALPGDSTRPERLYRGCWELVRRYMEEGPDSVYTDVLWCQDIATRRESYRAGLTMSFFNLNGWPIFQLLLSPIVFACSLGRWVSTHTSKIPVWPDDIESQCKVDDFDPYLRDASRNPPGIPMTYIRE